MAKSFRRLDAFAKTRPDLQQQSAAGGIITLSAAVVTVILFVSQVAVYIMGETTSSLALSESAALPLMPLNTNHPVFQHIGRLPVRLHVTFPHVKCENLDIVHDGASYRTKELAKFHGSHSITLRKPSSTEWRKAMGNAKAEAGLGCTVVGQLRPYLVAGVLSVGLSHSAWASATTALSMGLGFGIMPRHSNTQFQQYNVSHYIHEVVFGTSFPYQDHNPLRDVWHKIENDFFGIAVSQMQVKLVPTSQAGWLFGPSHSYQTSVVDITVQPRTLAGRSVQHYPGLVVSYDFTPLTVNHSQGRDNIFVFLSSLISIVAGAFVTVQLLTGCLVHSAQAVAKKID